MTKRGKILRDTSIGQGLLFIEGQQYGFSLEKNWKSGVAPAVGMVVDVDLNDADEVVTVTAIDETQLAKEQAEKALNYMKGRASETASGVVSVVGVHTLTAIAVLALGWFYFDILSIKMTKDFVEHLTFWRALALLDLANDSMGFGDLRTRGGSGIYGLVALAALVAPALPSYWKDWRAHFGGLMPLALMLIVVAAGAYKLYESVQQVQAVAGLFGGENGRRMMNQAANEALESILGALSLGLGFYLSLAASLYLAGKSAIKILASRA